MYVYNIYMLYNSYVRMYVHAYICMYTCPYVGHSAVPLSSTTTKSSKKYVILCVYVRAYMHYVNVISIIVYVCMYVCMYVYYEYNI